MNSEDFGIHVQRQNHKNNVSAKKSPQQQNIRSNNCTSEHTMPLKPSNGTIGTNADRGSNQKVVSSNNALNDSGNNSPGSRASSIVDIPASRVSTMKLADVIDANQFPPAIIAAAIDLTSRTHQRISHEIQIIIILMGQLKKLDSALRVMPFGSTRYGFGGPNTNFNILIDAGKNSACISFIL